MGRRKMAAYGEREHNGRYALEDYGGRKNTYRIGFANRDGEEDETELDAEGMKDLAKLWSSLCPEFNCKANSVIYVEAV